jgi:anti-sigma regulatory factor (Ser/Thr protein kinase)
MEQSIEISAEWDNIARLITFADELVSTMSLSDDQDYVMRLVIEEIATNIIKYGYEEEQQGVIKLACTTHDDGTLHIFIRDHGRPFDPRECPTPDLCEDVHTRAIGGLGLFLVLEFSDYLSYHHDATTGWNELIVVKGKEQ